MLDQKVHKSKAKEDWISENCAKIDELKAKHKTREMYQKVNEVTGADRKRS